MPSEVKMAILQPKFAKKQKYMSKCSVLKYICDIYPGRIDMIIYQIYQLVGGFPANLYNHVLVKTYSFTWLVIRASISFFWEGGICKTGLIPLMRYQLPSLVTNKVKIRHGNFQIAVFIKWYSCPQLSWVISVSLSHTLDLRYFSQAKILYSIISPSLYLSLSLSIDLFWPLSFFSLS